MKAIGFLSFWHWTPEPYSDVRTASDALLQSIALAVAARRRRTALPRFSVEASRLINSAEMILVVAIVFVAAFMARGAWLF